jgi:hypothetical protein
MRMAFWIFRHVIVRGSPKINSTSIEFMHIIKMELYFIMRKMKYEKNGA